MKENYTKMNQWHQRDPQFNSLVSDVGLQWPKPQQNLENFVEINYSEKQCKQFIDGLKRIYKVSDDPKNALTRQDKLFQDKMDLEQKRLALEYEREMEAQYLLNKKRANTSPKRKSNSPARQEKDQIDWEKERAIVREQAIADCEINFDQERDMYDDRISKMEQDLRETR